jgi:hypothetical protein
VTDQSDQSDQSDHSQQSQQSQQSQPSDRSDSLLDGEGTGEGIELTVGEPNSFEPEDDPEAADPAPDARRDPDPGTLI